MEKNTQEEKEKKVFLSSQKVNQLNRQPVLEAYVSRSEDGKWIIHKTIITDIKPTAYFEKVLA